MYSFISGDPLGGLLPSEPSDGAYKAPPAGARAPAFLDGLPRFLPAPAITAPVIRLDATFSPTFLYILFAVLDDNACPTFSNPFLNDLPNDFNLFSSFCSFIKSASS
jgi:hypothetical protein